MRMPKSWIVYVAVCVAALVINLALLAGAVWLVVWVLRQTGAIS